MTQTIQQTEPTIDQVKRALLAMQRHSWEQGVAAQAFLELGQDDLVIVMAKEAALRQREDGRLGVVGPNHAVTDPAANGEPVLYAANLTGDSIATRIRWPYARLAAPSRAQDRRRHLAPPHHPARGVDRLAVHGPALSRRRRPSTRGRPPDRGHAQAALASRTSSSTPTSGTTARRHSSAPTAGAWATAGRRRASRASCAPCPRRWQRKARG